jgi:hypothetical protein
MQSALDDLIGDVRTVVVAGINVVHAGRYRFSQNSDRGLSVARGSKDMRASQLHCAIAHAIHSQRGARQSEAAGEIFLLSHFLSPDTAHSFL